MMARAASVLVCVLAVSLLAGCGVATPKVQSGLSWSMDDPEWPPRMVGATTIELDRSHPPDYGRWVVAEVGGGEEKPFQLDTGWSGVLVSAKSVGAQAVGTGELFDGYTDSEGYSYSGVWVTAAMNIDPLQSFVVTKTLRIRAVTEMCRPYGGCTNNPDVAIMGIGYGRTAVDGSPMRPADNPLLNIPLVDGGPVRPGYSLTHDELTIGVTDDSAAGFDLTTLTRASGSDGDWVPPTGCVTLSDGLSGPVCGTFLVDTARIGMRVAAPQGVDPPQWGSPAPTGRGNPVASGRDAALTVGGASGPVIYSFSVDREWDDVPDGIYWGHDTTMFGGRTVISTGLRMFERVDYLFDAGRGQIGFRSR